MAQRILGWIVLVPLCVGLVVFALANRQFVVLNFNPFAPVEQLSAADYGVPLFVLLYVMLLLGVLMGGVATWLTQARHRHSERHWRREAQALTLELDGLRKKNQAPSTLPMSEVDDVFAGR